MSAQNDDSARVREAAKWLRGVSEKCCECTDGHHHQSFAFGTEADVRISRDTARALADWLAEAAESRRLGVDFSTEAEAVARGLLTGQVYRPVPTADTEAPS